MLQRKMGIGFAKSVRFIDFMESTDIVSEKDGAKPRASLITERLWRDVLDKLKDDRV